MADELTEIDQWVRDLIETLDPSSRKRVLRRIGQDLRRAQVRRMSAQTDPDGQKWAARRDGSRKKMMKGLRLARHLKLRSSKDHITVGWKGRTGGIARVHHYGLRDRISRRGIRIQYEARELHGLSRRDTETVNDRITDWLTDNL